MALKLFEHNIEAYNAAIRMLDKTGKAAVIHPTGTGKSFIGFKLAEDNPDKRIVWLTPSEYIVKTQLENLINEGGDELNNITFITYAKLMMMDEEELKELHPDVIITDELHRVGAEKWRSGFDRLIRMYQDAWLLGLSATNIRYLDNQRNMADELFDGNIASEMTLGEAIVRGILLPPKYVISVYGYQEELRGYEDRIDRIVNTGIRDKNRAELDRLRKALEMADGLDTVFEKNMDNRVGKYIVFCSSKAHMEEMASHAMEWFGKIDLGMHVYKVYSEDPTASKDFIAFKEDESDHLKLLFCIDMLNEGVHVNDIDGVILFRPTVSPIIYKQQIGRALSASKKHKSVIFDVVNNFDNLYSISTIQEEINLAVSYYLDHGDADKIQVDSFEIIDETCDCRRLFESLERSLSSTWEVYFQAAKAYYAEHGNLNVPKRYVTDSGLTLGMWLCTQRRVYSGKVPGNLTEAQIERLNAIGMRWENAKELEWLKAYNHAKEYFETYGNLDVKKDYVCSDGFRLGGWIVNMRNAYNNNGSGVTPERVEMLNKIGMMWSKNNALWERNFTEAEQYYRKNGHLHVPAVYVTENGVKLGAWINKLKRQITGDPKYGTKLTDEQIERLNSIGMDWDDKYTAQWKQAYKAACEYYKKHGNIDIPVAYETSGGILLGRWIRRQRTNAKLTDAQRKQLSRIGMVWNTDDPWELRYRLAQKYYKEHGDLEVPAQYKAENDIWLGKWVQVQRQLYKQGKLDKDKYNKLNGIGMRWLSVIELNWEKAYDSAKLYYTENGTIEISSDYIDENGFALGRWVVMQKRKLRDNKLNKNQIAKLKALGIEINVDKWQQGYQYLCEYRKKYGDTMVPASYTTDHGYRLGSWVGNQRTKYSNGKMSKKHIESLEKIGFVWNTTKARWKEKFDCAKRYYEQHGRITIPRNYVTEKGFKLNYWVNDQRKAYKKGKLATNQIQMLREIGIV